MVMLDDAAAGGGGGSVGGPALPIGQGLVLWSAGHRLMAGGREQWIFTTMMAGAAGSTRAGQIATKVPLRRVQRLFPVAAARRPSTLRAWARAEMGRHSPRMVMEAG